MAGALGVALGLLAAPLQAEDVQSPFLPPGFGSKAPPPQAASPLDNVEFRGVLSLEGRTFITLFDSASSRSFTLEVGETANSIKIVDYRFEADDDIVTLQSGGSTRQVSLKKPKIVAMATPPPTATPLPPGQPPTGQQPGSIAQPQGANSPMPQMSDEEVRQRMQRVAEEIRRRRAVRRQMLEENQAPGTR